MPKYFCDYCDTYLTHDSPSVRKTHCAGRKHRENVKFYYEKWYEENYAKIQQQQQQHQQQHHHQQQPLHLGAPPNIPPPTSFGALDFPPPSMLRGLPTGPPPPMPPNLANVMLPPPCMPPPHQLPMPNVMIPPPTTNLIPPPGMAGLLPPGMTPLLPPPPIKREPN